MIVANIGNDFLDTLAYQIAAHAVNLFRIDDDITITIQGGDPEPGADAECRTDDTGNFLIILDANIGWKTEQFCRVIGHELTHVKQHVFDHLDILGDGTTAKYKGEAYRLFNDAEYYLAPWEIEARGYEEYFLWRAVTNGWTEE